MSEGTRWKGFVEEWAVTHLAVLHREVRLRSQGPGLGLRIRVFRVAAWMVPVALLACAADREGDRLWAELTVEGSGSRFEPASVEGLPDPARRFLRWAIASGAPLANSVELEMVGEIHLDPEGDPLSLTARQILAPPKGFIWAASAGRGVLRITGFDRLARGAGEMRWAIWGVIPVMSDSGAEVTRSAAGRLAMESILLPSVLLPGGPATWEAVDDRRARFRMVLDGEEVVTTLEVDAQGRPVSVSAQRWSDQAGPGYDRFDVEFAGEMGSGGYRIPAGMVAGWRLGEADEFRFFRATLTSARFR